VRTPDSVNDAVVLRGVEIESHPKSSMIPPLQPNESDLPVTGVVPVDAIVGEDEEDTTLLRKMAHEADEYIRSFPWCRRVSRSFFAGGVGGIFAVFLFNIDPARPEIDKWIWIMVGDMPPAYLPLEDARTAAEVFNTYMQGMTKWVHLARQGRQGTAEDGVPPVNVPATAEWADKLEKRLHLLRFVVKPFFEDEDDVAPVN
jgi:hypothetical protein